MSHTTPAGKYWMVNTRGMICHSEKGSKKYEARKAFGDCFSSKAKAEKARDRMKRLFSRINKK